MTLNLQRAASELAEKIAALPARYPYIGAAEKNVYLYTDRSRARPDRPSIVRIRCSFPSEREFMTRVLRRPRTILPVTTQKLLLQCRSICSAQAKAASERHRSRVASAVLLAKCSKPIKLSGATIQLATALRPQLRVRRLRACKIKR
jgi:hypothetical protein